MISLYATILKQYNYTDYAIQCDGLFAVSQTGTYKIHFDNTYQCQIFSG